jgi:hypothetical protein
MDSVIRNEKFIRLSHTIITILEIDENRKIRLNYENHLHVGKSIPGQAHPGKCLGVTYQLPDGCLVESVLINGNPIKSVDPTDSPSDNDGGSFVSFPDSADTVAHATIFQRISSHRRDLISYEELIKAHRTGVLNQSHGLIVRVPPSADTVVSVLVNLTVSNPRLWRGGSPATLLSLGDLWAPIPLSAVILPGGVPATTAPMDLLRHRVTIRVLCPVAGELVVSGDRLSFLHPTFESTLIHPRDLLLGLAPLRTVQQGMACKLAFSPELTEAVNLSLGGGLVGEILQFFSPWFGTRELPLINILLMPLPRAEGFLVYGNTVVVESSILVSDASQFDRQITLRCVLAEAIAALWIARALPVILEPWIAVGLASLLAHRFVEFTAGTNEYTHRVLLRRHNYHRLVERGLEWRPLTIISDPDDPVLTAKAPLVMESIRRALVPDSDFQSALGELAATRRPIGTDSLFASLVNAVGLHTEAGQALPRFRDEWVRSVGCPLIHVGFTISNKRFTVQVTQRPLQRIYCHDNAPLCGSPIRGGHCACGSDFVCRRDDPKEGVSYMRPHAPWLTKRRFWPGEIEVSIHRAAGFRVTTAVEMTVNGQDGDNAALTVPFVTPRKHEVSLNRQSRDDELVHGWVTVTDDRWLLLARIVVCQSPLMWCNMLSFSRSVIQEHSACEALAHVKGSPLVIEALAEALGKNQFAHRVRRDCGKALVHMALGCGERDGLTAVIRWLESFSTVDWDKVDQRDLMTFIGLVDSLSLSKKHEKNFETIFNLILKLLNNKKLRINSIKYLTQTVQDKSLLKRLINPYIQSDLYGPPLASPDLAVTETVLSTAGHSGAVIGAVWPHLFDQKFLEGLAMSPNRRLARTAIRSYLSTLGVVAEGESESRWKLRFIWVDSLTDQIIADPGFGTVTIFAWLGDVWDMIHEKVRKEGLKSPIYSAFNQQVDRLWKYLTYKIHLLPAVVRSTVHPHVYSVYLHVFGTGLPVKYRESGALNFWLPFKEHERIYKKFMIRGAITRDIPPQPQPRQAPKKLILSVASTPVASNPFSTPAPPTQPPAGAPVIKKLRIV